jgi:hypothetical protein
VWVSIEIYIIFVADYKTYDALAPSIKETVFFVVAEEISQRPGYIKFRNGTIIRTAYRYSLVRFWLYYQSTIFHFHATTSLALSCRTTILRQDTTLEL